MSFEEWYTKRCISKVKDEDKKRFMDALQSLKEEGIKEPTLLEVRMKANLPLSKAIWIVASMIKCDTLESL